MSNTINRKKLDALKEKLSALPPREAEHLKTREAVSELAGVFRSLLAQNYSIEELWDLFKDETGSEISVATFRGYLNKAIAALTDAEAPKTGRKTAKPRKAAKTDHANGAGKVRSKDGFRADADLLATQRTPDGVVNPDAESETLEIRQEAPRDADPAPRTKTPDAPFSLGKTLQNLGKHGGHKAGGVDVDADRIANENPQGDTAHHEQTSAQGVAS